MMVTIDHLPKRNFRKVNKNKSNECCCFLKGLVVVVAWVANEYRGIIFAQRQSADAVRFGVRPPGIELGVSGSVK